MIFPLKEPCPGKCLVIVVSRIELRSFAYSLLELYCLSVFSFFWALGFSGLALKVAGVFFCRDDVVIGAVLQLLPTWGLCFQRLASPWCEVSAWLIEGRGVRKTCGICLAGTPHKKGIRESLDTRG